MKEKSHDLQVRLERNLRSRKQRTSQNNTNVYPFPSVPHGETQIAKAMANKLKIPFVDPLYANIEPTALALLKPSMALELQAVPIRLINDTLLVAMADPQAAGTITALKLFTSCKILPAAAPRSSVAAVLQKIFEQPEKCPAQNAQGALISPQAKTTLGSESRALTIAIISNKGGVGKTHLSINMAYALAKTGAKVLLIDTDLGNADISSKLSIFPELSLLDFMEKEQQVQDIIISTKFNFDLICSQSGDFKLANLNYAQKTRFIKQFQSIRRDYDFVVFDLGAGISRTVLDFALAADRTVIVTTPQNIISGYACAKASFFRFKEIEERLARKLPEYTPQWTFTPMLVINQIAHLEEGFKLYNNLAKTANDHINIREGQFCINAEFLGAIPYARQNIRAAESNKRPLLLDAPYAKVSQCIQHLSDKFSRADDPYDPRVKFRFPFRRFIGIFS